MTTPSIRAAGVKALRSHLPLSKTASAAKLDAAAVAVLEAAEAQRLADLPRAPALGSAPDLAGYAEVFADDFETWAPFHPDKNRYGHWAIGAGPRAYDGSIKTRRVGKAPARPLTLAEIDADPVTRETARGLIYGGEHSLFEDDTFQHAPGLLTLKPRWVGGERPIAAPNMWLTDGGKPRAFRYGWFEAELRADVDFGGHPAWWLTHFPGWEGEIDIVEILYKLGQQAHHAWHLDNDRMKNGTNVPASVADWHRYGLMWTPERLNFYIDRGLTWTEENPGLHMPLYPILNHAVASPWALKATKGVLPTAEQVDAQRTQVRSVTVCQAVDVR